VGVGPWAGCGFRVLQLRAASRLKPAVEACPPKYPKIPGSAFFYCMPSDDADRLHVGCYCNPVHSRAADYAIARNRHNGAHSRGRCEVTRGRRVVLLGTTGIEKRKIADRLHEWTQENLGQSFHIIDFEKDYLTHGAKGGRPMTHFLAQPVAEQYRSWLHAWEALVGDDRLAVLPEDDSLAPSENVILIVHASIVRGNYGVRCVCDFHRLARFGADVVVTLMDDVFSQWWVTEHRAHGEFHRGRPTLEQLIMARRTEQLLGDLLALQGKRQARHLVLAALHPRRTLGNFLFTAKKVVYLSFPISRPRELFSEGDPKGVQAVNDFLAKVYAYQVAHADIVFVNPLAIDELEILPALNDSSARAPAKDGSREVEGITFDLKRRWNLSAFWPSDDSLSPGPLAPNERRPLIRTQVEEAAGLIRTGVGWRDFRLVMQADALAVFNPVMWRDRLSRGVEAEMLAAIAEGKPVYVYQDPELDPDRKMLEWIGSPGTMAADQKQQWVVEVGSIEEMLGRLGT